MCFKWVNILSLWLIKSGFGKLWLMWNNFRECNFFGD